MQSKITFILLFFALNCSFSTDLIAQNYAVGQSNFQYSDASRSGGIFGGDRDVDGDIYYPATTAGTDTPIATGEFPVIVFGHGFGMNYTEYEVWWDALVACGYILIFPQTEGSVFPFPSHPNFALDMVFLTERFIDEATNNTGSAFYQSWNGKSAVMGHSMGGGCSYLAAEGTDIFTTLVSLAAADTNPSSVAAAANLMLPSLTVAGTADCVVMSGQAPIDHYNNATAAPYKAYVEIIDGMHCQFGIASSGSICTTGENCSGMPIADQHAYMLAIVKPWLEYYLKDDCQGWDDFEDYRTTYEGTRHNSEDAGTTPEGCSSCASVLTEDGLILDGIYQAGEVINSAGQVTGTDVEFRAGDVINLNAGFTVPATTDFDAIIESCQ